MGGILGFLSGIFSSISGLGAAALKAGAILALDIGASLLGGSTQHGEKLKNKTIASSTYGHAIPRARGTVRLQGQLIFWNQIQETTHKNSSGGFLGLGQHSVYTYTYSSCCAFTFGKKLGGGAAVKFVRIWADGKLLYNSLTSDASLTGTATVVGTPAAGSQIISFVVSSGGSLTLSAGDLIQLGTMSGGNFVQNGPDYEVQQDVTIGSGATGNVDVYPPIDGDLTANILFIPGLNAPLIDTSSFDPDPHDGSHVILNPVPAGAIRFHYGSATEEPDPIMLQQFGTGQCAAYRGLPYVMLAWLQLANFGNHIPGISAEIAFDDASNDHPFVGAIPGVSLQPVGGSVEQFLLPSIPASELVFRSPSSMLPFLFVPTDQGGSVVTLYKIDTRTNTVVGSVSMGALNTPSIMCVDSDGFIYFAVVVSGSGIGTIWAIEKWDGSSLSFVMQGPNLGFFTGYTSGLLPWDLQASAFGSPAIIKLLANTGTAGSGGINFFDRNSLLQFGAADILSTTPVVLYYATDGTPVVGVGDPTSTNTTPGVVSPGLGDQMVVDSKGNLWFHASGVLSVYDCIPQSGIYLPALLGPSPQVIPCLLNPSFDRTDVDVSEAGGNGVIYYDRGTDSIIVTGNLGLCRVDCKTLLIVARNLTSPPWGGSNQHDLGIQQDQMGTFLIAADGGLMYRYDASSLALLDTYTVSDWLPAGYDPHTSTYDGITDSVWWNRGGSLYRLFLDRGAGAGLGLDLIVGSIFAEAGYDPSEYDVTALAAISTGGYEIDQEPYLDSIKKLQQLFLFDMAEVDGVLVCVLRSSGLGSVTIPEDDLGATEIGTAPVARVSEVLQQETDCPQKVWVQYYDSTKQLQQATQYAMRITAPYSTALAGNPKVTNSKNQVTLSVPVTDTPAPMKQQAQNILLDAWQARMRFQLKTAWKYLLLTPTDKVQVAYKGQTLDVRLTTMDTGAGLALEFQGESYDSGVYTVPAFLGGGGGSGGSTIGGTGGTFGNPTGSDLYTLDPPCPLHQI